MIELEPGAHPTVQRQFGLTQPELDELRKQLDDLLEKEFIRSSSSPFAAPILFTPKKDGGFRMCIDYRALNRSEGLGFESQCVHFGHPSAGGCQRSTGDPRLILGKGYRLVVLGGYGRTDPLLNKPFYPNERRSRVRIPVCALRASQCGGVSESEGLKFESHCMHFGHPSAGGGQRSTDDPRLILGKGYWLVVLGGYGRTDPLLNKPFYPNGLVVGILTFVPDMAKLTAPLIDLLRKGVEYMWGGKEQAAFSTVKKNLCSPPVLHIADPHRPFELVINASDIAVGAILLQDSGNGLQPIAYEFHELHPPERNYPIHDREILAIVHAFKVTMDFVSGLPSNPGGNDAVMVVVDGLTKMAHFAACRRNRSPVHRNRRSAARDTSRNHQRPRHEVYQQLMEEPLGAVRDQATVHLFVPPRDRRSNGADELDNGAVDLCHVRRPDNMGAAAAADQVRLQQRHVSDDAAVPVLPELWAKSNSAHDAKSGQPNATRTTICRNSASCPHQSRRSN
ncbi:unnamed protein product [Closterium sp. NIES-53]